MPLESWLPIHHELPDGALCGRPLYQGGGWQIIGTVGDGRALIAKEELHARWLAAGLIDAASMGPCRFGSQRFFAVSCGPGQSLAPVDDCRSPVHTSEALAFAMALRSTRELDPQVALQDAIYVERLGRLLPTYLDDTLVPDAVVLGAWLSGGVKVSALEPRFATMLNWMTPAHLQDIVQASGVAVRLRVPALSLPVSDVRAAATTPALPVPASAPLIRRAQPFELAGRPLLEAFFNEHVVDVVRDKARYAALGVGFPAAVVLHGPPGCGKTFAVEQLVAYLGWPCFHIDASSVASPYIHETSRKVAAMFERAMHSAPSVLVIDEMDAFLSDRERGGETHSHRVEEVAEFLRRIPEAAANEVLVIGMTNRLSLIDPAVLRRGRFDHVLQVDPASQAEVQALLDKLLASLPCGPDVDTPALARALVGRPLSDVAFVVREGARLSARAGCAQIEQARLLDALAVAPSRTEVERRMGFV